MIRPNQAMVRRMRSRANPRVFLLVVLAVAVSDRGPVLFPAVFGLSIVRAVVEVVALVTGPCFGFGNRDANLLAEFLL